MMKIAMNADEILVGLELAVYTLDSLRRHTSLISEDAAVAIHGAQICADEALMRAVATFAGEVRDET